MGKEHSRGSAPAAFDPDADRHPSLRKVLSRIASDKNIPDTGIERVSVEVLASGEATYKVRMVGSDEDVGGYYANSEFS